MQLWGLSIFENMTINIFLYRCRCQFILLRGVMFAPSRTTAQTQGPAIHSHHTTLRSSLGAVRSTHSTTKGYMRALNQLKCNQVETQSACVTRPEKRTY